MLGLGAIPALGTFYLRNQIAETPRFALAMNGDLNGATHTIGQVIGTHTKNKVKTKSKPTVPLIENKQKAMPKQNLVPTSQPLSIQQRSSQ